MTYTIVGDIVGDWVGTIGGLFMNVGSFDETGGSTCIIG
jgi:hypothetical protein